MNEKIDFINKNDLAFFGQVNASISHELKNILAIISETAGLLQDLTQMAANGERLELGMLETCSQDIIEEVQRGFTTVKQMNKFSHSVDDPVKQVNLADVVDLMVAIAKFLSFASEIDFDQLPEDAPVVLTCPFRLQNLIYRSLVFAFESSGPDGRIRIAIQRQENGGVHIIFSGLSSNHNRVFASDEIKQIAAPIGVEIRESDDSQILELVVPENVGAV